MKTLALALRPRSLSQLYGLEQVTGAIRKQMASKRTPNAWLFGGETGSGKTTIARIMALSMQCDHKPFGSPCKACRQRREEFCIAEPNASEQNTVEAIKDIAASSLFAPTPGSKKRVIILDEAQRITKDAQAILLKYFEDAPVTTCWIICTTDPERILKALRGRCMTYILPGLKGKTMEEFIKWAAKKGNITRPIDDFIDVVNETGVRSPRIILNGLEKYGAGLDPEKAVVVSDSDVDTKRLCQNLVRGEWPPIRSELERSSLDDAKLIRGAVLGYLRSVLLNPKETIERKKVCQAIDELGKVPLTYDEVAMSAMLASTLYKVVKIFG